MAEPDAPDAELPFPSRLSRARLHAQRLFGHVTLLPFCGLLVALMRLRGWKIEGHRELRRWFRAASADGRPLLVCANHLTFADSAILIWAFGSLGSYLGDYRRFSWNLPAGDFFKKGVVYRVIAACAKCLFIDRTSPREEKNRVLGACRWLLQRGEVLTLFPEGRRSRLGLFERDRLTQGTGKLLHSLPGCRVLCVYVRGDTQATMGRYPERGTTFRLHARLLEPKSSRKGREAWAELTDTVGDTIAELEREYLAAVGLTRQSALARRPAALVTGASSGIGEALAETFAADGHDLVAVGRDEARLTALAAEWKIRYGCRVWVAPCDLSRPEGAIAVADLVKREAIPVGALVNNAGFGIHGPFERTDLEAELRLVALQLGTALTLTKACLPELKKRRGRILNVASVYAFSPVAGQAVYGACKSFLLTFSRSLAAELRGTGVGVTTLCPGTTRTAFRERAGIRVRRPDAGLAAREVAREGYRALRQGKAVAVPGRWNRVYVRVARVVPPPWMAALTAAINRVRLTRSLPAEGPPAAAQT